jgi:hypothetical protein
VSLFWVNDHFLIVVHDVTFVKSCQLYVKEVIVFTLRRHSFYFVIVSDHEDVDPQSPTKGTTPKHTSVATITAQLSSQSDDVRDEEGSLIMSSPSPVASQGCSMPFLACDVGSFTDAAIPLLYCSRHLAASFLLTGCAGLTVTDSSVRVSVKALALSCIANIIRLSPNIIFLSVDKNKESNGTQDGNKIHISIHESWWV